MIYTSYFGNVRKLHEFVQISIALYTPRFLKIPKYSNLAPHHKMLEMPEEQYRKVYAELLSRLDPEQVLKDLQEIAQGNNFVLLCYEKPNEFCHRHLVADWLNTNCKTRIIEYGSDELTLF